MNKDDVAALVERLEGEAERLQARTYSDRCTSPDCALASNVATDAASAIKALAAENARLQGLIRDNGTPRFNEVCRRAEEAEAKAKAQAAEIVRLTTANEDLTEDRQKLVDEIDSARGYGAVQKAHAEAAEAKLREAAEVMRKINSAIFNDNGDVTWNPLAIREAARAFLSTIKEDVK